MTWAMNEFAQIEEVKSIAENLRLEAKSGKLSRSRLESLKPFIMAIRELADILSPFLETSNRNEEPSLQNIGTQNNITQSKSVMQVKKADLVFTITNTKK